MSEDNNNATRIFAKEFVKKFPKLHKYLKKQKWKISSLMSYNVEVTRDKHYHQYSICHSATKECFIVSYLHTGLPVSQQSGYRGEKEVKTEKEAIEFLKQEQHVWQPPKSKYTFIQHVWRGLGNLECCGDHPGVATFWFMVVVGALIGMEEGLFGMLFKAFLMSMLVGIPLCYGAYERSKLDERDSTD